MGCITVDLVAIRKLCNRSCSYSFGIKMLTYTPVLSAATPGQVLQQRPLELFKRYEYL